MRHFLLLAAMLYASSFTYLLAQNWQEYHVLNEGNHLSWQRTILFNASVIQSPDPSIGTLSLQTQGSTLTITFTPIVGAEGVAEFIIEYFPNQFPPAPKVEAFRIFVSQSFIEANKDYFSVQENSIANVLDVLANDVPHPSTAVLSVTHVAAAKNGDAVVSSGGQFVEFTPDTGFVGMAYLTYVVCDDLGACAKVEANICVMTDGPIALEDTIYLSTQSQASVVAFLPSNEFTLSNGPSHGTVVSLSPDTWEYTPENTFDGTDAFTFTTVDLVRHFIVDVYYKDAPNTFANGDQVFTRTDEAISFDVLANDLKQYPVDAWTEPEKGILVFDTLGYFTYTPDSAYVGAQRFTYTTCFLSNCESADVIIYVGDMIPENAETYHLVTPKDVPLVLNYEIPLDGYAFSINALPSTGTLILHSGYQSISVLCSTIEGYDLIEYTPPAGYTGGDYFEIVYCIDGGACHLVKVDVDVVDSDSIPCPCVDNCVWPGDADGSGQVTMNDLLSIGWQLGYTGPERNYPDNTAWMGQSGDDWAGGIWGMNSKFADSDGDGVIAEGDVVAVADHYLFAHTLIPEVTGLKADYTFEIIPITMQVDSGDLAVFEISIGSESDPVLDMHGMSFSLNLPENLVDLSTVAMNFNSDSWLGHNAPSIDLQQQPGGGGRLDAAFTRTTGTPASGIGAIGTLTFIVVDDIEGFKTPDGRVPLRVGVNGVNSMDSDGLMYDVPGEEVVIYIDHNTPQDDRSVEDFVFVFPNPSSGEILNVHVNGDRTLQQIDILDLSGSVVYAQHKLSAKHFYPDISALQNGLYFLRISTTDGVVTKKFEVFRDR